MTIALCMIVGGDDPLADGLADSIASARPYVDEVCLWANGPRAHEVAAYADERNRDGGAPIRVEIGEWADDFAAARNASYAMASSDWILCLDANDRLVGGERLREAVALADDEAADIVWCLWDRYDNERYGWWPSLVRASTGRWQGIVHECWRRPGIDRWRHGVGQPGSVWAHPAALRVFHADRLQTAFKYLQLEEKAAEDPETTPWALARLAEVVAQYDIPRAIALYERDLRERRDDCEGTYNSYRAGTLQRLAELYAGSGKPMRAQFYAKEWDKYTRALQRNFGPHMNFLLKLGDEATVNAWASLPADEVDVLLDPAEAS